MTRDELLGALSHDNVTAFLRVIRQGETSQDDDTAYRTIFGGKLFEVPPWEHPNELVRLKGLQTTAAGAYQFLARTWYSLVKQYGFPDFSPSSQDQAAVALIAGRGALDDVIAGRLDAAIRKCSREWASLPYSPYGQPTLSFQTCREVFASFGGREAGSPVSVTPDSSNVVEKATNVAPSATPKEVNPMGALLPLVLELIPSLISVFGSPNDSEVAKRNQAAGVLVADTLVKATQANNLADAVGKMQSNPDMLQTATDAVHELLPQLMDVGGGVETARKFASDHEGTRYGRVLEVVTYAGLFFLLLANLAAFAFAWDSKDFTVMADIKQADIGVALIVFGYWLGTSISSKRKDELKGAQ